MDSSKTAQGKLGTGKTFLDMANRQVCFEVFEGRFMGMIMEHEDEPLILPMTEEEKRRRSTRRWLVAFVLFFIAIWVYISIDEKNWLWFVDEFFQG